MLIGSRAELMDFCGGCGKRLSVISKEYSLWCHECGAPIPEEPWDIVSISLLVICAIPTAFLYWVALRGLY